MKQIIVSSPSSCDRIYSVNSAPAKRGFGAKPRVGAKTLGSGLLLGAILGVLGGPGRGARGRGGQNQGPTPILAGVTFAYENGPENTIIYY